MSIDVGLSWKIVTFDDNLPTEAVLQRIRARDHMLKLEEVIRRRSLVELVPLELLLMA